MQGIDKLHWDLEDLVSLRGGDAGRKENARGGSKYSSSLGIQYARGKRAGW